VVELAKKHINIVVVRTEIDYKGSLRSGDAFVVGLNVQRLSHVRFVFEQEIYRLEGNPEEDAKGTGCGFFDDLFREIVVFPNPSISILLGRAFLNNRMKFMQDQLTS